MGGDAGRAERMKKYKEERRQQLAAQTQAAISTRPSRSTTKRSSLPKLENGVPSSDCGADTKVSSPDLTSTPPNPVRTTRASRLRTAASSSQDNIKSSKPTLRKLASSDIVCKSSDQHQVLSSRVVDSFNDSGETVTPCSDGVVKLLTSNGADSSPGPSSTTKQPSGVSAPGPSSSSSSSTGAPRGRGRPARARALLPNEQDDTSARKGRHSSSGIGVKSESSEPTHEPPKVPFILTRAAAARLAAETKSSSPSPSNVLKSQPIKQQPKRRTAELNTKPLSRTSPGPASRRTSEEHKFKPLPETSRARDSSSKSPAITTTPISINGTATKRESSVDKFNSRSLKSREPSLDVERIKNKRLSNINDKSGAEDKNKRPASRRSDEDKRMTPGVEKDYNSKVSGAEIDNKALSSKMSSLDSPLSNKVEYKKPNTRLTSRMDRVMALTKETLARVDRLAGKTPELNDMSTKSEPKPAEAKRKDSDPASNASRLSYKTDKPLTDSKLKSHSAPSTSRAVSELLDDIDKVTQHLLDFERQNSISSSGNSNPLISNRRLMDNSLLSYTPVSILKRKSSQEEHGSGSSSGAVSTPPVTFSPSVVEPKTSRLRRHGQGILKKRRSLDESQVNRHRSCSPEVAFAEDCDSDSRPILKTQRRSSLEEVIRGRSPDGQIQGILKRKYSRDGELLIEDRSLDSPEPQGILKRKSNSSSSSSTASSHVSISQAVILAAAGGAELIEDRDGVRPILKKKSFSEERPCSEIYNIDTPKPILKKKSLTESDDNEYNDKPKKTILKSARKISQEDGNNSSFDLSEDDRGSRRSSMMRHRVSDGSSGESGMRPILKQRGSSQSREHSQSPRPRLSFCSDDERSRHPGEEASNQDVPYVPRDNPLRISDGDASPRASRFDPERLQSPSKLKDLMEGEGCSVQLSPHFPSVVLRRRDLRPRDVNRSKSLVSSDLSDELNLILNARRSHVDESCSDNSREASPEKLEVPRPPPRFPSIAERIQSMEQHFSKDCSGVANGAVPKRNVRQKARYKTQPVTVEEMQSLASLDLGQGSCFHIQHQPAPLSLTQSFCEESSHSRFLQDRMTSSFNGETASGNQETKRHSINLNDIILPPERRRRLSDLNIGTERVSNLSGAQDNACNLSSGRDKDFTKKEDSPETNRVYSNFEAVTRSPSDYHPGRFERQYRNEEVASNEQRRNSLKNTSASKLENTFEESPTTKEFNRLIAETSKRKSFPNSENPGNNSSTLVNKSFHNLSQDQKESPTTKEFNRLYLETFRRKSVFDSDVDKTNWDQTYSQPDSLEACRPSIDPPAALSNTFDTSLQNLVEYNKKEEQPQQATLSGIRSTQRPSRLFSAPCLETGYQRGGREAALQELDRLETELEDVRTRLDADSSALCGPRSDHWSLNVSVDSGVFNRMSSGDSGPLSGEDPLLAQEFSKQPDVVNESQIKTDSPLETDKSVPDITKRSPPASMPGTAESKKTRSSGSSSSDDEEAINSPQALHGLMKSNSVVARASMWQQLQQQANRDAIKPVLRHSRSKAADGSPSVMDRFKTQPITTGEVEDVEKPPIPLLQSKSSFNVSLDHDEDAKLDENDPAKLTLAEKMKLFGAKVTPKPPMGNKKPRSPRFQTMPVLASQVDDARQMNNKINLSDNPVDIQSPKYKMMKLSVPPKNILDGVDKEDDVKKATPAIGVKKENVAENRKEIGANFRNAQNILAEQASRMLTPEVKGILKSQSGAIPLLPSQKTEVVTPVTARGRQMMAASNKTQAPEKPDEVITNVKTRVPNVRALTKGESSEGLKDEGIDSSSDEESGTDSSDSSDECSSSSASSDQSEEAQQRSPEPPLPVRPSQLKASRTESSLNNKVLNENAKSDGRIKLPCMDEMRARKIMERCMKSEKENVQKTNIARNSVPNFMLKKDFSKEKTNIEAKQEAALVKLKNLKNGSMSVVNKALEGSAAQEEVPDLSGVPDLVRKYAPGVMSKSQSMHVFNNSQLMRELKARRAREAAGGSGSDGESSGDREVRYINTRRRHIRPGCAPVVPAPLVAPAPQVVPAPLGRSATQPLRPPADSEDMPQRGGTIADRLAALQQSGNNDWRKRVSRLSPDDDVTTVITQTKNRINESLTQQAEDKKIELDPVELTGDLLITERRNKLETSAQGWKKRVGVHDAPLFSVAGRMGRDGAPPASPLPPALLPAAEGQDRRTPVAARFKSRRAENGTPQKSASSAAVSQPASPLKGSGAQFRRSVSVSGVDHLATPPDNHDQVMTKSEDGTTNGSQPSVPVPRADDETFTSFYTSASQTIVTSASSSFIPYNNNNDIHLIAEDIDLDAIDSGSRHMLGGAGMGRVRAARRAGGSRNPLRALAARTDLRQEYTQPVSSGLADKEVSRLNRDKLAAQNSSMAVEALAGLAAREDFGAVQLRRAAGPACAEMGGALALEPGGVRLVHIKGRRRVQARLAPPTHSSVNSGDCYVLVTADQIFNYAGLYSNVIERSRAAEIALHIHTAKDLGCANSTSVITLDEERKHRTPAKYWKQFWTLLGVDKNVEDFTPTPAGNSDEDEIYESGIIPTNMCYEVLDDELVPIQEYWGQIPKIAMLDPSKILVFDFGSELYVWNGKNTILENRRRAFQLAQELWDEGYDYKDCHFCPLEIPLVLGARSEPKEVTKKASKRPDWAMITKVTQHMENILFRDKFLDWPDFTRVIKVKEEEDSMKGGTVEIKPCDAEEMWKRPYEDPSLVLEGSHVGRGTHHYDPETMRHFEIKTKSVTKWVIQEYDYCKIDEADLGEFYSGDSYIIRWEYQMTVTGRELNGKPSKHNLTGRDRCAYFCWQGKDATANEKGAAALLTVELDHEKGPQVRVAQGCEPPAFLNLFNGSLVIHQGKKGTDKNTRYKLFMVRGNVTNESHLVQVPCSMRQLRSRASMIIVDTEKGLIHVWNGAKSLKHTRTVAMEIAKNMAEKKHPDMFDASVSKINVTEVKEGDEPKTVIDMLGGANRQLYHSLVDKDNKNESSTGDVTPRLFHFTDLSGQFDAVEVLSPLRHESLVTPYPFSQQELYSASQPGLFMLDSGDCLWLWQGWWPQNEDNEPIENGSGAGALRWQLCRRAAMETLLQYWACSRPAPLQATPRTCLATAGLEPLAFTNLFDAWHDRDDIAEINIQYGHSACEGASDCSVSEELCRLSRTSFPLAVLRQRPLPDAVDPAHMERYLTDQVFQETFAMTKEEFYELPSWKQANMKKDLGLF